MRRPRLTSIVLATQALLACTGDLVATGPDASRVVEEDGPPAGEDGPPSCGTGASVLAGGRCNCASECANGAICAGEQESGFPGGACFSVCIPGVPGNCGPKQVCLGQDNLGICTATCATSAECGPGRICGFSAGDPGCIPHCDEDIECRSGHCNVLSGLCTDGLPVPGAGVDEPCARKEDCQSGICAFHRCVSLCDIEDPHCPSGAACTTGSASESAFCHVRCAPDGRCPLEGTECRDSVVPAGLRICLPVEHCLGRSAANTDGRPCGCDADCDPGSTCSAEGDFPNPHGACYRDCTQDRTACGPGGKCNVVRGFSPTRACHTPCKSTADCDVGRVCDPGGACEPVCWRDDQCQSGHCDRYSGFCKPQKASGFANGANCLLSEQCLSGICSNLNEGGQKYCLSFCYVPAQGCPDGGVCVPFGPGQDLGVCQPRCSGSDATCPRGARCSSAGLSDMSVQACQ